MKVKLSFNILNCYIFRMKILMCICLSNLLCNLILSFYVFEDEIC